MGSFFSKKQIPYSFIHVPNHKCSGDKKNYIESSAKSISSMITHIFPFIDNESSQFNKKLICEPLPTEISQIKEFKNIMNTYSETIDPQCGMEFSRKLKSKLKKWKPDGGIY